MHEFVFFSLFFFFHSITALLLDEGHFDNGKLTENSHENNAHKGRNDYNGGREIARQTREKYCENF